MKNNYFEKFSIIFITIFMVIVFIFSGVKCLITNFNNIEYIILMTIALGVIGIMLFLRLLYDRTR